MSLIRILAKQHSFEFFTFAKNGFFKSFDSFNQTKLALDFSFISCESDKIFEFLAIALNRLIEENKWPQPIEIADRRTQTKQNKTKLQKGVTQKVIFYFLINLLFGF